MLRVTRARAEPLEVDPIRLAKFYGSRSVLRFYDTSLCKRAIFSVNVTQPTITLYRAANDSFCCSLRVVYMSSLAIKCGRSRRFAIGLD